MKPPKKTAFILVKQPLIWLVLAAYFCIPHRSVSTEDILLEQRYSWQQPFHKPKTKEAFLESAQQLTIKQALLSTLENQPAVKISQMNVGIQMGVAEIAIAPFDPLISVNLPNANELTDNFDPLEPFDPLDFVFPDIALHPLYTYSDDVESTDSNGNPIRTLTQTIRTTAFVQLIKELRNGTLFTLTASVDRLHDPSQNPPQNNVNKGLISFRVLQPLLNGFLYGSHAMTEIEQQLLLEMAYWNNLQDISQTILDTTTLYWELVAAIKLLQIQKEAEMRYARISEKTLDLINAGELAFAELDQPLAQLAAQKTSTILAEDAVYMAYHNLKFAMGDENVCLPMDINLILEDFYPVRFNSEAYQKQMDSFLITALDFRYDIQSALIGIEAADVNLKLAYNEWLPTLNVISETSQHAVKWGQSAKDLFSSLDMKHPETDYFSEVDFSVPLFNDKGVGGIIEQYAAKWQAIYEMQLTSQQAIKDIRNALVDQLALAKALKQVNYEVEDFQEVIRNKNILMGEGKVTIFELLTYEDQLTGALNNRITIHKQYMQNIAKVRFLTATLINERDDCSLGLADVTRLPLGEVTCR